MNNKTNLTRRDFLSNTRAVVAGTALSSSLLALTRRSSSSPSESAIEHVIVASEQGRFFGWPANNGLWSWDGGREILVGYTNGRWEERAGHNIAEPYVASLARSIDGGKTWRSETPDNYVSDAGDPASSPGNINFGHADFALRISAAGYIETDDTVGRFFVSYDRGKTWGGPYRFNQLHDAEELEGMEITSRTSYLVTGPDSARIMMTARNPELEYAHRRDKPFVAETTDGGRTFTFVSWVVPWTEDCNRAAMPSTVRTPDGKIIVAVRVRNMQDFDIPCWIDAYVSEDDGRTWAFLSNVAETGVHNGNPAGLTLLRDGRLACSYANRTLRQMRLRFSGDHGATWGEEIVIRDNPYEYDLGYPQIIQNAEGKLVIIYYIAQEERPHSHIEAAILEL